MKIADFKKANFVDYPGKIACTIYTADCNYRCGYCDASNLVLPEKKNECDFIPEKDLFKFLKGRKGILEGVAISGGEPTVHDDLPIFLANIKKMGYDVALSTNGSNPEVLKLLLKEKLVDFVSMDVKSPKEKYAEAIGFGDCVVGYLVAQVEESIDTIKESGIEHEFKTTLVPNLINREDFIRLCHWVSPGKRFVIQRFRPENALDPNYKRTYSDEFLLSLRESIMPFFDEVIIR